MICYFLNKKRKLIPYNFQWGKWLLILLGIFITTLILIIPILFIFITAFSKGLSEVLLNINNIEMIHAIFLTLLVAIIVVPINIIFVVPMAWLITKFNFFGRKLLLSIMDIPFSISPVIAGSLYLMLYGTNNIIGNYLYHHNIKLIFSCPGIILVTIFVTCPFILRELIPLMSNQGNEEEEAALLLGATGWQIFSKITLPKISWALIYGILITNARAIGEFGAVSIISGSIRGETCTLPLQIELLYQEYNIVGAFTGAVLLTMIAFISLFFKNYLKYVKENYY